jgi:hypothetical protein
MNSRAGMHPDESRSGKIGMGGDPLIEFLQERGIGIPLSLSIHC